MEQDLEIVQNGDFKNLNLKPNLKKGVKGLENGNHVIIGKTYKDGLEKEGQYGKYYIIRANYKGDEVSFFLNDKEHLAFSNAGDIGDNVKITLNKEPFVNPVSGVEMLINRLKFEKVE